MGRKFGGFYNARRHQKIKSGSQVHLSAKIAELHDHRQSQLNQPVHQPVHRRTKRLVKVVSEGEAMHYSPSTGQIGYDQKKGTSANSDRERSGASASAVAVAFSLEADFTNGMWSVKAVTLEFFM